MAGGTPALHAFGGLRFAYPPYAASRQFTLRALRVSAWGDSRMALRLSGLRAAPHPPPLKGKGFRSFAASRLRAFAWAKWRAGRPFWWIALRLSTLRRFASIYPPRPPRPPRLRV